MAWGRANMEQTWLRPISRQPWRQDPRNTCNGTTAQNWTTESNGTLQALGKCLDMAGGGTTNGTPVDLLTCNGTGAQTWQPQPNGALVNPQSGKCLDDTGFSTTPGTQSQIWSCTGNANQSWQLP